MKPKICITTVTEKEWKKITGKKSKKTWGWVNKKYCQPEWCNYPDALNDVMGCWSLISWPWKIDREYCKKCSEYIKEAAARSTE